MSYRAPRGPSATATRRQKPNTRASNQNVPSRTPSGFLDGLKNIVAGPLSWFGGGGQDGENDVENEHGDKVTAGSKRRGDGRKSPPASPRKRVRRNSPPPASNSGHDAVGGYLDPPPEVLRDCAILPNGTENRWDGMPSKSGNAPSVTNGIKSSGSDLSLSDLRRPHRLPSGLSFQQPPKYQSSFGRSASRSPTRQSYDLNSAGGMEAASQPNGVRRQSSVMNLDFGPRREPQTIVNGRSRNASSQGKRIFSSGPSFGGGLQDHSVKSPMDTEFTGIARSPSIADRTMVSPERDRSQGPLRMGSLLRNSVAPLGRQRLPMGPFGSSVSASHQIPLLRRSSSVMSVEPLSGISSSCREPSQIIFEPSLGITTVGEADAAIKASSPAPRVPRNNAERILLALEQATPLTDARRIRQKQKEALKVPVPGGLSGRTSRMLNPYGRPALVEKAPSESNSAGSASEKGVSKAPGALRRYLDSGKKPKAEAKVQTDQEESKLQPIQEDLELEMDAEDQSTKKATEVKVQKADKSVEAVTPEKLVPNRDFQMPGRPTSSLRSARAPTFRSHMPSSRPTKKSSNRFSANFADEDDDEGMTEDKTALSPDDLTAWAKSKGAGLEVPAGWNFNITVPTEARVDKAGVDSKQAAADTEKQRRDELVRKLVGGNPSRVDPFAHAGPPMLPAVPSKGFFLEKSTPASQPVASVIAPDTTSRPNPFSAFPGPKAPTPAAAPVSTSIFGGLAPEAAASMPPKGPTAAATIVSPPLPSTESAKPSWFTQTVPAVVAEKAAENAGSKTEMETASLAEIPKPLFGGQPTFAWGAAPTSSNGQIKPQADAVVPEPARSKAPSPSPFAGLGKGFPSSAPVNASKASLPAPPSVTEPPKAPIFSIGAPPTMDKASTPAPPPSFGSFNVIKPAAPALASQTSVSTEHKPPPLFGSSFAAAPAALPTPAVTEVSTKLAPATPPVSLAFSFNQPSAATLPAPVSTPSPFQFTNPTIATTTTAATTAATTAPSLFPFGAGSQAKPTTPLFTLTSASNAADAPSKPVFAFGAAFGSGATSAPTSKPITPPPQELDSMMDEGSPNRNAQVAIPAAPSSNIFSFSGSASSPFASTPAAATASTPAFSFNTKAAGNPFSNPFAPTTNGTSNTNIFSQPAPASPFASHASSPFPSPHQPPQTFGSPAVSAGAFGSPQQAPVAFSTGNSTGAGGAGAGGSGFTFLVNTSVTNSPTQAQAVTSPSTSGPAFVFSSGTSNPNSPDRPIKPLRRTGSTAARRGSATRGR
ncbi:hypothetical protein FRB97_002988 [Tulasnella sp. 331]|nr:hypothetical protein FRB97_002988 [Tulasnella sp. 331]